ncbi:hypothetical protein KOR42_31160 [Thalassoglobus neptunius]|uniref:Uncharacterized protein n=1 Tax=Thalassoglobus neptunius TaxID=1938619 RepID=A0A5C5WNN7_9PLAN|nr:hypothetical protein [Thalassoglobus neptunius]TWT52248.1 hypothetical protein KOR42_31160 [Thalassoglobus neptunius]
MNIDDPNTPVEQKVFLSNTAQFQRWFPWLRIFRSARFAVDYQILFTALIAVLFWSIGLSATHRIFSSPAREEISETASQIDEEIEQVSEEMSLDQQIDSEETQTASESSLVSTRQFLNGLFTSGDELHAIGEMRTDSKFVSPLFPVTTVTGSSLRFLRHASLRGFVELVLGLAICAFFGGAISRMAAREFTANRRWVVRDAKFATGQFPMAICAPMIPALGLLFFWGIGWFSGLLGRIPYIGEWGIALAWLPLIVAGLLTAVILLGLLVGWPLMFVSSSIERNDSFDAFSRTFSYLWNRPWYAVFLIFSGMAIGWVSLAVVYWVTEFTLLMTLRSVGTGLGFDSALTGWESLTELSQLSLSENADAPSQHLLRFCSGIVAMIPVAYAFSFFWCCATIIYFLLRRYEDGTPLDVIDLSDSPHPRHTDLPLVGVPAAEKRESEIQAAKTSTSDSETPSNESVPADSNEETEE